MEKSTMNTQTTTTMTNLSTYQCVVCQITFVTLTDLHRHQSYRHTPEELSLSTIGLQCSAIKIFDSPNGIVYDNSWLYDPNRHAEFYAYSADMLSDDNNNGCIVDYTFKKERGSGEGRGIDAGPCNEDRINEEECFVVDESLTARPIDEPRVDIYNFIEQESRIAQPTILDLTLKVSSETREETKARSEMLMDTAEDDLNDIVQDLCDGMKNMNREPTKRKTSSAKCPVPLKARKLSTRKKLQNPENGLDVESKRAVQKTEKKMVQFEKQESVKEEYVEQVPIFDSQDSLSASKIDKKKNSRSAAKTKRLATCQKKPLNLKKVEKKPAKQEGTAVKRRANRNVRKETAAKPTQMFSLKDFLSYLQDDKAKSNVAVKTENLVVTGKEEKIKVDDKAEEETSRETKKSANPDYRYGNCDGHYSIFDTDEKIEEIEADNLAVEQIAQGTEKLSNNSDGNGNVVEHNSTVDFGDSLSCLERKEAKIGTSSAVNAKKPIASKKKVKNPKTVADNPLKVETARRPVKASNQNNLQISDFDESSSRSKNKEAKSDLPSAVNTEKPTTSRKKAKNPKTVTDKLKQLNIVRENLVNENSKISSGTDHSSIFDTADFQSHFVNKETQISDLPAVKSNRRAAPRKRAKSSKIVANKPPNQETTHETKDPINEDCGNDSSVKQNSTSILDVYSYTADESEETKITPLSEFRAEQKAKPSAITKKSNDLNSADENRMEHDSSFVPVAFTVTDRRSKDVKIDVMPTEKTPQRRSLRKKSMNSLIVIDKPAVRETTEEIPELFAQDSINENSVEQNSTAIPEVHSFADDDTKEMIDTLPAGNSKNPTAFTLSLSQMIDHPKNQQCENMNSLDENSPFRVHYSVPISENQEAIITSLPAGSFTNPGFSMENREYVKTATHESAMRETTATVDIFIKQCGNENSLEKNSCATPDVYSFAETENDEEMTNDLPAGTFENPNILRMQSAQMIHNLEDQQCENMNSFEQNSTFVIDYSLPTSDNEVMIETLCPENLKNSDIFMTKPQDAMNPESEDRENINSPFLVDHPLSTTMNEVTTPTSAVTFVAYPPDLDDFSALAYDPKTCQLVWQPFNVRDPDCNNLEEFINEMSNLYDASDNDNRQEFSDIENITIMKNIDNETSSNSSSVPVEINESTSINDSSTAVEINASTFINDSSTAVEISASTSSNETISKIVENLEKNNRSRRSTRSRSVIKRYVS